MKSITFDDTKWQLVPIEPTDEMIAAGRMARMNAAGGYPGPSGWQATLAAAPQPPAEGGWRDIASADKDAASLMLGIVRNGALEEIHIGGFRHAYNDDEVSCWWSDQCDDEIIPTHWMPLPPAPANGGDQNGK